MKRFWSFFALLSCLAFTGARSENSFAEVKDLKPEELVAQHVKALGSPETLAQIKTRSVSGSSDFKFIIGATGQMTGPAQWVSEKGKIGIVIRYGGTEYPGEHFAYDGKNVMVDNIKTGQRSPLGDFLYSHGAIIENGLLGGVLNVGWPLLNVKENAAKIKCRKRKIDDRELYELEYRPKKSMGDVKVKMYFDPETFHHVMTEYRLRLLLRNTVTNHVITEKFGDFRDVDGISLPNRYSLDYMTEGGSGSMQMLYTIAIEKIGHNGKIDPRFYAAQK